jgi:hypothetical protein
VIGVIFVLWLLGTIGNKNGGSSNSSDAPAEASAVSLQMKESIKKALGGFRGYWKSVEVDDSIGYGVTITYKKSFSDYAVVEGEVKLVARIVLKDLVKSGHNPKEETITIFVYAYQDAGKGETGAPLVRRLGKAMYDPLNDTIGYETNW